MILFIIFSFFRIALMPPAGVDPLSYHCSFPAIWLQQKSCWHYFVSPDYRLTYYPVCAELISFFNIVFSGTDTFIELHQLESFIVLCLSAYSLSRILGADKLWSFMTVIYLLSIPQLTAESSIAKNNVFMNSALMAGVLFFIRFIKWKSFFDGIISGIGFGIAVGTKVQGFAVVGIFGGILICGLAVGIFKGWIQGFSAKKLLTLIGIISLISIITVAPRAIQIYIQSEGISEVIKIQKDANYINNSWINMFQANLPHLLFRWFVAPFSRVYHSWGAFSPQYGHCGVPFALVVFPFSLIWLIYSFRSFRILNIREIFAFLMILANLIGIILFLFVYNITDDIAIYNYTLFAVMLAPAVFSILSKYIRSYQSLICLFFLFFAFISTMGTLFLSTDFRMRNPDDEKGSLLWASSTYCHFMKLSPNERTAAYLGSLQPKGSPTSSLVTTHEWERLAESGAKVLYVGGMLYYPVFGNDFSRHITFAPNFEFLKKALAENVYDWIAVATNQPELQKYIQELSGYEKRIFPSEKSEFSHWSTVFYERVK